MRSAISLFILQSEYLLLPIQQGVRHSQPTGCLLLVQALLGSAEICLHALQLPQQLLSLCTRLLPS